VGTVSKDTQAPATQTYTAQGGETLQGLAKMVCGNSNLWYQIARDLPRTGKSRLYPPPQQ